MLYSNNETTCFGL